MASNSNGKSSSDERDAAEVKKALATGQAQESVASPCELLYFAPASAIYLLPLQFLQLPVTALRLF